MSRREPRRSTRDGTTLLEFHRPVLEDFAARYSAPGYLVAVADDDALLGVTWVRASPRPRVITIGRHTSCGVSLPSDDDTPLRKLVILVRQTEEMPRARVFDIDRLREADATSASHVVADTHIISAGDHFVIVARTKHGHLVEPGSLAPLAKASALPSPSELHFPSGTRLSLPASRLQSGVLLGRYGCCFAHEHFDDESTSRIHALLVEDAGDILLLDAGSTNGLVVNGEHCAARALAAGDWVRLGHPAFEWIVEPGHAVASTSLFPTGVEEALAQTHQPGGHAVFADWLLERGSPWGDWIAAELNEDEARATDLRDAIESRLLGPMAVLQERRWDRGVLVEATLAGAEPLRDERALRWPLWAGVQSLDVSSEREADHDRLLKAGVLRSRSQETAR